MRQAIVISIVLLLGVCSWSFGAETVAVDREVFDQDGSVIGIVTSEGQFIPRNTDVGGQPLQGEDNLAMESSIEVAPTASSGASEVFAAADINLYSPYTIDRITASESTSYSPQGTVYIVGRIDDYYLNNGSSWSSGAGSYSYGNMSYRSISRQGVELLYQFDSGGLILRPTDYDSGDHSAHFQLDVYGPLVLRATEGATTATLNGLAEIVFDGPANYADSRFHMLSSPVGSIIPFEAIFTLKNGKTFTETIFTESFNYTVTAEIDVLNTYQDVELDYITIFGPTIVPAQSYINYTVIGVYVNGAVQNLTEEVTWSVEGSEIATVNEAGQLATGEVAEEATIILQAVYTKGETVKQTQKTITVIPKPLTPNAGDWSMYQASTKHNGYLPATLWPEQFELLWQVQLPNTDLNRITAADGKVFTSGLGNRLDVVDGLTGSLLWSKTSHHRHGSFPSFANGIVYMQWGNHSGDTYLEAYDANTGEVLFKAPHSAQWENYYAPTVYGDRVFVNGGYYGGAYCFDAFTGNQYWFKSLAQYDDWTPAVDADYAYAYVGGLLSALDKQTGNTVFSITDNNFDWHGWSMDLAPVIGGNNNVLAIYNGRLICFDLVNRQIGFELLGSYSGQPCVADSVIYAINDGDINAIDEITGHLLWTYAEAENFIGEMIITDSHFIARSSSNTYVISLEDQQRQWQYPVSGYMAMSDNRLYVAGSNGYLTAFSMPNLSSNQIVGFEIKGLENINEYGMTGFQAAVEYEGGYEWFVTSKVDWSITCEPEGAANIDQQGRVTTYDKDGTITITAHFTIGEQSVEAHKTVNIVHPITQYYVNKTIGDDSGFGLTEQEPFASIQRAIDEAWDGDTVFVEGGIYEEVIDFLGKEIIVKAVNDAVTLLGPNLAPLESSSSESDSGAADIPQTFACVVFDNNETEASVLENFIVTGVFAGIYCGSGSPTINNVTSVRNGYGLAVWGQGNPKVNNSIFWANSIADCYGGTVSYSCVERGAAGEGNILVDPLFADIANGDYHLLSERGRYNPNLTQWVLDDVTSSCIAAGDPTSDSSKERMPNGGRINMGAYGGLYKASMKDWPLPEDTNYDGVVNLLDLALLAQNWLVEVD